VRLTFEGDSLTLKQADGSDYPTLTAETLTGAPIAGAYSANLAVGGSTLTELNARAASLDSLCMEAGKTNWLAVWIGSNDLNGGNTTSALISSLTAYVGARKAAGWQVAVLTVTPRVGATYEARRSVYNAAILSGQTGADVVIDVAADPRLANCQDTTYYNADAIHQNATGRGVVAELVAAALSPLLFP
jgi:lysophospholipase L1-like esterase